MKASLIPLIVLSQIQGVSAHAGGIDTGTNISFSLEQIFFITALIGVAFALLLYRTGIIRSKQTIHKMLIAALIFLSIDYLVFKFLL